MIHSQSNKVVVVAPPVSDANEFTTTEIDTLGFDYCTIYVFLGETGAAMTKLEVHEGDVSGSHSQVSTLVYGSSADISGSTSSLPSDTNNLNYAFDIDLRKRKRYLDVDATAGGTTLGCIVAVLSRADDGPVTAAERGLTNIVRD